MAVAKYNSLEILLVEDNPGDARLFKHHLNTASRDTFPSPTVTHVQSMGKALDALTEASYNLVLLDLGLPESSGLETLDRYLDSVDDGQDQIPVVVLTGLKDDKIAIEAIERGAQDYLFKDEIDENVLNRTIRYALERHRQQQQLQRQNRRLERFANVVSHDLRNPLNVAMARVELIDHEQSPVIERNLKRMEAIISDVLTLAREGDAVEETEQINLKTVANDAWRQVKTSDATLSCEKEAIITANRSRWKQLLENLFRNSVEHGGNDVTIRVGVLTNGFYIEDDGPGIPEKKQDSVFEPGYSTNEDGTGLGLNIVQEIAQSHGWAVDATNGADGGARFEFTGLAPE